MTEQTTTNPAVARAADRNGEVMAMERDDVMAAPAPLSDARILELARQQGDEVEHGFIFNKDGRWSVLTFARALLDASRGVEGKS